MMTEKANATITITSDMRHNHNCYSYLLQLKPYITPLILNLNLDYLNQVATLNHHYDPSFPYGDLYSNALATLEELLDSLYDCAQPKQKEALDNLIFAVYHNDNRILEHTEWINDIGLETRPLQMNTSQRIKSELEDKNKLINQISPYKAESVFNRIHSLFAANMKSQLTTNLSSLKNYSYRKNINPIEYRFGTQAQRHSGQVRISPLFKRWLLVYANRNPEKSPINYIYFNNLSFDRSQWDIPGWNERNFSVALHQLEQDPALKLAVITLPASKSLMSANHYEKTEDHLEATAVFKELLEVAEGKKHSSGISDFQMSSIIRSHLFGDEKKQSLLLTQLLLKSFKTHGISLSKTLSTAKKQAIWVHFIKYELTDYIITTLNPNGFNFSCKDAIDRGALSSLYYNLMKSFTTQQPMQREEFERALDGAAANVKGRGMNFHRKIIWNALDSYVSANYDFLLKEDKQSWLIFWRDMNCPHSRVGLLLSTKIKQLQEQLDLLDPTKSSLRNIGYKLLNAVKEQQADSIHGQRLLLELISRTSQLLIAPAPSQASILSYKNLAQELQINHPYLHIIGGLAEIFLGILLFIPSLGYSNSLICHGLSTYKTGFFSAQRAELGKDIIEFSDKMSLNSV